MDENQLVIAGLPIGSRAPLFLAVLAVHVLVAMTAVLAAAIVIVSEKGRPRHVRFGRLYFRALLATGATAMLLAVMRWKADYYLFLLAVVALAFGVMGARTRARSGRSRARRHAILMSTSFIVMLTAFYVDNGPHLPLWRLLPTAALWVIPTLVGAPILVRVLRRHPLTSATRAAVGDPER